MTNQIVNTDQAKVWEKSGPFWLRMHKQLDLQVNNHGLRGIDAADPSPGERVFDIGCGTGTSSFQIAKRLGPSGSVVGGDISSTMVDAATGRLKDQGVSNVSFVVADAQVHKFDQPFDLVFSRFGVMFFADPPAAFANIHAALKPTGRIAFVCWQAQPKNPWLAVPRQAARPFLPESSGIDPNAPGGFSMADPSGIESLLGNAGFSDIAVEGFEAKANLGADAESATEFMASVLPGIGPLAETDAPLARKASAAIRDALAPFAGPGGVEMDSATWIVTARA